MLELVKEIVLGKAEAGGGGQTINNEDLTITANGEYTASEGYTGIGTATVNVPQPTGTINITTNGTANVNDYQYADVSVPQYEERTLPNATGLAISSGDKVWVDEHTDVTYTDNYQSYQASGTTLTISDEKLFSNSASSFVYNDTATSNATTREIVLKLKTSAFTFSSEGCAKFFSNGSATSTGSNWLVALWFGYWSTAMTWVFQTYSQYSTILKAVPADVSSFPLNDYFYVRLTMNGSSATSYYSFDGESWTTIETKSVGYINNYTGDTYKYCYIGNGGCDGTGGKPSVYVDLTGCSVMKDDEYEWSVVDTISDTYTALVPFADITEEAVTGVALENISNGASGKVAIGELGKKYGATINDLLGDIDSNGVLQLPNEDITLNFSGVQDLGANALSQKFRTTQFKRGVVSLSFPNLTTISGQYAMDYAFFGNAHLENVALDSVATLSGANCMERCFQQCYNLLTFSMKNLETISQYNAMTSCFNSCGNLTSVDLRSLKTVSGNSAMQGIFQSCQKLTSINLESLEEISGNSGMSSAFYDCRLLSSMTFPKLKKITSFWALSSAFQYCSSLTSLSFPALKSDSFGSNTSQFYHMLSNVTGCTVHFPSNLQSVIGSWSDVTGGFDGTNTTVAFDLPATE